MTGIKLICAECGAHKETVVYDYVRGPRGVFHPRNLCFPCAQKIKEEIVEDKWRE